MKQTFVDNILTFVWKGLTDFLHNVLSHPGIYTDMCKGASPLAMNC
jgi:hypothetical protein